MWVWKRVDCKSCETRRQVPREVAVSLFIGLSCFVLAGCWSSRELNEAAIVAGVGFDRTTSGDESLTVQIVQPGKLTPKVRGQSDQAVYFDQSTGKTTFQAIRNFTHEASRKLFWSHCQVFVLGHDLARSGVTERLNWFNRNQELRPSVFLMISETKAEDILRAAASIEPVPAYQRADEIKVLTDSSTAPIVHFKDYMEWIARPEQTAFLPTLKRSGHGKVTVTGTAVFLRDKLVGTLNQEESRGLLSLLGKIRSGAGVIPSMGPSKGVTDLTFEIIHQRLTRSVSYNRQLPTITYHIRCLVDLADDPDPTPHTPEDFRQMELAASDTLREQVQECLRRLKEYHADIIEAGREVEKTNPQLWHKVSGQWDQLFPDVPIQVDVKFTLRHEGLVRARI